MLAVNFDPIERGYVAYLAQRSGNITGVIVRPIAVPPALLAQANEVIE